MHPAERFSRVLAKVPPRFLLASPHPALLTAIEPVLQTCGAGVEVVLSLEAVLAALSSLEAPTVALIDVTLLALDPRMCLHRLLAEARTGDNLALLSIVLISDAVTEEVINRLAEGAIDDVIQRTAEPSYWRIRVEMLLRNRQRARELDTYREAAALNAQTDHLTGVYNRETTLATLFRETDRVQRMKSSLSLILLDIDDFGHWNSRLGNEACDDLLCQVAGRISRLMRSYDILGRPGKDEFLLVLPGCTAVNAVLLAERIRLEVFCVPFRVEGEMIRLSACFGVASSQGRSPVVVLREAETALEWARTSGPESIQCYGDCPHPPDGPVAFLSPSSGDELLAW
jgi:two-component system cell cycle response regulator